MFRNFLCFRHRWAKLKTFFFKTSQNTPPRNSIRNILMKESEYDVVRGVDANSEQTRQVQKQLMKIYKKFSCLGAESNQDKLWLQFWKDILHPMANQGYSCARIETDETSKILGDLSKDEILVIARRKGFTGHTHSMAWQIRQRQRSVSNRGAAGGSYDR